MVAATSTSGAPPSIPCHHRWNDETPWPGSDCGVGEGDPNELAQPATDRFEHPVELSIDHATPSPARHRRRWPRTVTQAVPPNLAPCPDGARPTSERRAPRSPARRWAGASSPSSARRRLRVSLAEAGRLRRRVGRPRRPRRAGWVAIVVVAVWNLVALVPVVMVSLPGATLQGGVRQHNGGHRGGQQRAGRARPSASASTGPCSTRGASPRTEYTLGTLVSGVWNNFVKLGLPVIALVLLAATGDLRGSFVLGAAIVGVVVMARHDRRVRAAAAQRPPGPGHRRARAGRIASGGRAVDRTSAPGGHGVTAPSISATARSTSSAGAGRP